MAKYVVDASVALRLLREGLRMRAEHELLAPTLIRSQVLEALYCAVQSGQLAEEAGLARLASFSEMRIRFLGDKVLRRRAWGVATELGWDSTHDAEYIALTQLQGDAFITLDAGLASAASEIVATVAFEHVL